jgi:type IV secretory pathway VirB2 component (pilin)
MLVLVVGLAFDHLSLPLFNVEFPRGSPAAAAQSEPQSMLARIVLEVHDMSPIAKAIAAIGCLIIVFSLLAGFAGSVRRRWKGERSANF